MTASTTGDLTWLVLVAFVFAWFAGAGVGWIYASIRWEKRLDGLLEDNRLERHELTTRIQGWAPEPAPSTAAPPPSAPAPRAGSQPAEPAEWDATALEEFRNKGIIPDEGGGWYDTHSKWVFDSPRDVEIWRAMLRAKKLPITLNPGQASEMGYQNAMALAYKFAEQQKEKRIAEESGDQVQMTEVQGD